jgi:hypothetical protein
VYTTAADDEKEGICLLALAMLLLTNGNVIMYLPS